MRLGIAAPEERLTVSKLASDIHASEAHVAKIVARLVDLGVARSVRGRIGGVYISEDAYPMGVGQLVRHLEGDAELVECISGRACPFVRYDCLLRYELADAKEAFYQSLDRLTIGDLLADAGARYPVEFVLKE